MVRMVETGRWQQAVMRSAGEIARTIGSSNQTVVVALNRVVVLMRRMRHQQTVLVRLVMASQRPSRMLEHLVVEPAVDDAVAHPEYVAFRQRLK